MPEAEPLLVALSRFVADRKGGIEACGFPKLRMIATGMIAKGRKADVS